MSKHRGFHSSTDDFLILQLLLTGKEGWNDTGRV